MQSSVGHAATQRLTASQPSDLAHARTSLHPLDTTHA
jgi:hypothetical protein